MIYFAQFPTGSIKIGCSTQVEKRLRGIMQHHKSDLILLATQEGDREREKEIHKRFRDIRLKTSEQFKPSPELLQFIGLEPDPSVDWQNVKAVPPVYFPKDLKKEDGEPKDGYVNLKIEAEHFQRLKKAARLHYMPVTQFCRMSIADRVNRELREAKEE